MKKNNGITMITVLTMVIIMIVIASLGIITGNKLVKEAKEQKKEQEYTAVKNLVSQYNSKLNSGGVFTPVDVDVPGEENPTIEGRTATGWYLLTIEILESEGIQGATNSYLVNYENNVAISLDSETNIHETNPEIFQ